MEECLVCNKVCGNKQGLSRHLSRQHNMSLSGYQISYVYGSHPVCKCGCGEKVNWFYGNGDFRGYIQNHIQKTLKKPKQVFTEEGRREKISKTLKRKYASGERKSWCQTNPNARKIIDRAALRRRETISNMTSAERSKKYSNDSYKKTHSRAPEVVLMGR